MKILQKTINPVFQLLTGIFCIWIVIFVLTPFVLSNTKSDVIDMAQEKELDAGALFYTESPEAIEAGFLMLKDK